MIKFLLFGAALFLTILFGILPASSQDTTGRINEMFLKSIVSIEKSTPNLGTGFLISKYAGTTGMRAFLVTNKHMIGNWSPVEPFAIDPFITVNLYSTIAGITSVPVRVDLKDRSGNISNKVKVSPDPKIDVAVIELTDYYAANPTLLRYFYDTSYLVPLKQISAVAQLGFGSQVFALGYPSGLK